MSAMRSSSDTRVPNARLTGRGSVTVRRTASRQDRYGHRAHVGEVTGLVPVAVDRDRNSPAGRGVEEGRDDCFA